MIDKYLKREEVIDFIKIIKTSPKYNLKNNIDSTNYGSCSEESLSLYILYDALLKYKIIVDNDNLFGTYIEQLEKIFKKIDNYEDVLIGVNKLVCFIVSKHLKIEDLNSEDSKKQIISYVYDKYISNGYFVHGFNCFYLDDIKKNGFKSEVYQNRYNDFNEIKEILEKNNCEIIDKDFSLNKTYFTDDFIMGCYYSAMAPGFYTKLLFDKKYYGNKIKEDGYLKCDFDTSVSYLKKYLNNNSFNEKDKKKILDVVTAEWNYLNTIPKKISLLLVKRKLIEDNSSKIDDYITDDSDIYAIVDRMLNPKYTNVTFDGMLSSNDIIVVSLENFFDGYSLKEEKEDLKIDSKMNMSLDNKEFLDSYGKVYIFLILGSLLISLGVIVSLIFTLRGI